MDSLAFIVESVGLVRLDLRISVYRVSGHYPKYFLY